MDKIDGPSPASKPLFRLLGDAPAQIRLRLDGETINARADETVAGLLLRLVPPETYRRSAVSGAPRTPLCLMGVCFECLVEIDGQKNLQGCMVTVREGMHIRRQTTGGVRA